MLCYLFGDKQWKKTGIKATTHTSQCFFGLTFLRKSVVFGFENGIKRIGDDTYMQRNVKCFEGWSCYQSLLV